MTGNMYIYGAGEYGKKLYSKATNSGVFVEGFIDKYKSGELNGKQILSMTEFRVSKRMDIIISVQNLYSCVEIYYEIKQYAKKIFWFWDGGDDRDLENELVEITNWGDCILPRLDMHLSDKCNLNCVGCTHFSPLFDEVGCEYDECMNNLNKILSKYSGVARLNLLGGEPLLNDDLTRIIPAIRKKMPNSTIVFFTNGLLLCNVSEIILQVFKSNRIRIYISDYKPTDKIIKKIKDRLDRYGVLYTVARYDEKAVFNKPLCIDKNMNNKKKCISDGCVSVAAGKIARCPTLLYIDKLNHTFDCEFPNDGIYDLDDADLSGMEINKKMRERVSLCDYCIDNEIEWNICSKQRKLSDFVQVE